MHLVCGFYALPCSKSFPGHRCDGYNVHGFGGNFQCYGDNEISLVFYGGANGNKNFAGGVDDGAVVVVLLVAVAVMVVKLLLLQQLVVLVAVKPVLRC